MQAGRCRQRAVSGSLLAFAQALSCFFTLHSTMAVYSCYICKRDIESGPAAKGTWKARTTHHLLPRALHANIIKSGLWTREDCLASTIDLCSSCHTGCHSYFTHVEMARFLTTPARLKKAMLDLDWITCATGCHSIDSRSLYCTTGTSNTVARM